VINIAKYYEICKLELELSTNHGGSRAELTVRMTHLGS